MKQRGRSSGELAGLGIIVPLNDSVVKASGSAPPWRHDLHRPDGGG